MARRSSSACGAARHSDTSRGRRYFARDGVSAQTGLSLYTLHRTCRRRTFSFPVWKCWPSAVTCRRALTGERASNAHRQPRAATRFRYPPSEPRKRRRAFATNFHRHPVARLLDAAGLRSPTPDDGAVMSRPYDLAIYFRARARRSAAADRALRRTYSFALSLARPSLNNIA